MHISWTDLETVLAIAEAGRIARAAKVLQLTQPSVSRRLAELESKLGEALFIRSARGVQVTPFGDRFLVPARGMAEWSGEAARIAEARATEPEGVVRITAPPGVAADFLAPFAGWLRRSHPKLSLEVVASIGMLDLSRREADVALRLAVPVQRDVEVLASLDLPIFAFASPAYVASLSAKVRAEALSWIVWAPPLDHLSPNPELAAAIPNFRPAFASDDIAVQIRAAEAGVGAVVLAPFEHRFTERRLIRLHVALPPAKRTLHLAASRKALAIPRVRVVADLLAKELEPRRARRRS